VKEKESWDMNVVEKIEDIRKKSKNKCKNNKNLDDVSKFDEICGSHQG